MTDHDRIGPQAGGTLDPQYLIKAEFVERPAAERPAHETIDTILAWLADPVRHVPLLINGFDEFAWRLLAAGFPLLRTTLHVRTLHPQYLGASFVWWRTTGQTVHDARGPRSRGDARTRDQPGMAGVHRR